MMVRVSDIRGLMPSSVPYVKAKRRLEEKKSEEKAFKINANI